MRMILLLAAALAACAGDAPEPMGNLCTKALYDRCTTEHDCDSNNCRNFAGDGIQVCTVGCDANNPCPDQNGAAVTCNNMGVCKPPAANDCSVP